MKRNIRATIQRILAHCCVICGMVIVTFQILDWYNPYMDFLGHAWIVLNLFCFCSVLSGFLHIFGEETGARSRRSRREGGDQV